MKRICTYCKETKDITQFSLKSNGKDGRNSLCKTCVKIKADARISKRKIDPSITEKKCTKCKHTKNISEFARDSTKQDGHYSSCKSCNEQYVKEYRQKNPDKVSSAKRNAYLKRKDYYENYKSDWYKDNFDKISKKAKKYREDNRDLIAEYNRKKIKRKETKL